MACASGKSEETIEVLVELGADWTATTLPDLSIFHLACLNGHDLILKLLLNMKVRRNEGGEALQMRANGQGVHPIHFAAASKTGSLCLDLLVALGVDVNMRAAAHPDSNAITAMHVAALNNRTSCALILYNNGSYCSLLCLFRFVSFCPTLVIQP